MCVCFFQEIVLPKAWQESLPLNQQGWLSKALYRNNPASGKPELRPNLQMWWYPPEPVQVHSKPPASPHVYFLRPFFLWAPQRIWGLDLRCTEECRANQDIKKVKVICNTYIPTYNLRQKCWDTFTFVWFYRLILLKIILSPLLPP